MTLKSNKSVLNNMPTISVDRLDASYFKTVVIDFWLNQNKVDLIINEAPFFKGNRRADLIIIQDNYLLGFEIKSELDSLKNLEAQIDDYIKIFDIVYVVLARKFAHAEILKKLPTHVGIIIFDGSIIIQRQAKPIKKFKKENLVSLLWRKDLEKILNNKKLDFEKLQKRTLSKITINTLKQNILLSLKERYGNNYKYFLKDRGSYTTIEDLRTITRISKEPYFF